MAQVRIRVNGRDFTITCDNGQEDRLRKLGAYFDQHVSELSVELGQIGDARLMLLSALTVCDELFEERAKAGAAESTVESDTEAAAARAIDAVTERIHQISQ